MDINTFLVKFIALGKMKQEKKMNYFKTNVMIKSVVSLKKERNADVYKNAGIINKTWDNV